MNPKELLLSACKGVGVSLAQSAAMVGWAPQQLSGRIRRNSLKASELLNMLDKLGVEIVLVYKETGQVVKSYIKGYGRPVRCMVDRVIYDTSKSNALSNNFYADGEHEYTDGKALELYVDAKGRYFFAEYSEWEGTKDRITPVTAEAAAEFIRKYGTKIDKTPTPK